MRRIMISVMLVSLAMLVLSGTVFADAGKNASCLGIEASEISPPGSSDEFPGGMPALNGEVKEIANFLGAPPGAIYGAIAKLHEGSHVACDEALE